MEEALVLVGGSVVTGGDGLLAWHPDPNAGWQPSLQ